MRAQRHTIPAGGRLLRGAALGVALLVAGCADGGALRQLELAGAAPDASMTPSRAVPAASGPASARPLMETAAPSHGLAASGTTTGITARTPAPGSGKSSTGNAGDFAGLSLAALKRKINAAFTPDKPPRAERQRLGDALAARVLADAHMLHDAALQARLQRIVRRLAPAARAESDFPARWRIHIIDSDRADAFTSGGGHLFITRGMIALLGTDERIATVLAHEMAHNLLAHVWDAREKKDMARRANEFSRRVLAQKMRLPWLGKSVAFLVRTSLNTYSRQQEYDADALGLHLLVQAGWRPQAALDTFDYLRRRFRERGGVKNFFYSHHPLYTRRRWYLANRIKAYYRPQAGLPPVRRANWQTRP